MVSLILEFPATLGTRLRREVAGHVPAPHSTVGDDSGPDVRGLDVVSIPLAVLLDDTAGVLGDGVPEARVVHDGLKLAIPTDDMVHRAVAAGVARGLVVPQLRVGVLVDGVELGSALQRLDRLTLRA
ncbi:hypothetical protein ACFQRB_16010 [Halobaculum litoreum]|uniref:Uncharacterized protein n=1 Tax=Halobaculum litoreum TaxID=3031998 RepID=A0ABD5XR08_9EURY